MKKKIVALCLVLALALTAVGGATLAYFTDKDQVNNTFAIGNIKINLKEKTEVKDQDGNTVQGAVENKKLENGWEETGAKYDKLMPSYRITKEAVIGNTGDYTAYVRVFVKINNHFARNAAIDATYEKAGLSQKDIQAKYTEIFDGWGINNTARKDGIAGYNNVIRNSMAQRTSDTEGVQILGIDSVRIPYVGAGYQYEDWNLFPVGGETDAQNDNDIPVEDGYYRNAIEADSNLYIFYLKMEAGKSYTLFNGLNIPPEFTADQMNMFAGLNIDVYADAIQADGFNDTTDAVTGVTTTAAAKAFEALEAAHPMGWWN